MKGLRTQESPKFEKFIEIIQSFAKEQNSVFFLESGEGHDILTEDFEGEDLSGWLIPATHIDEFEDEFMKFAVDESKWEQFECFANWHDSNGQLTISFDDMAVECVGQL